MKKRNIFLFTIFLYLTLMLLPLPNQAVFNEGDFTVSYDDNIQDTYITPAIGDSVGVRFTPPTNLFKLSGAILYVNSTNKKNLNLKVLDASMNKIMEIINMSLGFTGGPTVNIDFPDGPVFTPGNVSDFYIIIQWVFAGAPNIGVDTTSTAGRSYTNTSGIWASYSSGNVMIRAKVEDIKEPQFDHIPLQFAIAGESITISMQVIDEFGVESVTLYYRETNMNYSYEAISLTLSGDKKNGIWYGSIPAENLTTNGLEYYLWATDIGGNSRYYGNSATPYTVTVFEKEFEIPLVVTIIIIIALCAAAVVLYLILPAYRGEDTQ